MLKLTALTHSCSSLWQTSWQRLTPTTTKQTKTIKKYIKKKHRGTHQHETYTNTQPNCCIFYLLRNIYYPTSTLLSDTMCLTPAQHYYNNSACGYSIHFRVVKVAETLTAPPNHMHPHEYRKFCSHKFWHSSTSRSPHIGCCYMLFRSSHWKLHAPRTQIKCQKMNCLLAFAVVLLLQRHFMTFTFYIFLCAFNLFASHTCHFQRYACVF